jgi:hypothetical protein
MLILNPTIDLYHKTKLALDFIVTNDGVKVNFQSELA